MNKFNIMDKNTFWDNTNAQWHILTENTEMNELITLSVNLYHLVYGFEVNFNKDYSVFYIRTNQFAIRIANKWGEIGNCDWSLDRDHNPEKYQMAILNF